MQWEWSLQKVYYKCISESQIQVCWPLVSKPGFEALLGDALSDTIVEDYGFVKSEQVSTILARRVSLLFAQNNS